MSILKVNPWGEGQGDFVIIEEENFRPGFHTLYGEKVSCEEQSEQVEKPRRGRKPKFIDVDESEAE